MNFNHKILPALESKYNVKYPILKNATYKSLVNYATDLKSPVQRWYRYKEGYSIKLMQQIFNDYKVVKGDIILDPFCGSGSTIIQAKINGFDSIGFEINPFSAFLAKAKTQNYKAKDVEEFIKEKVKLFKIKNGKIKKTDKPKLSTIDKLFDKSVLAYLLNLKSAIKKIDNIKARDLYFLAWLSVLEECSNYKKAGNGLKIRRTKLTTDRNYAFAEMIFKDRVLEIEGDLPYVVELSKGIKNPRIYEHTSLEMDKFIKPRSLKGVIFSPPYANCFDYTEIYKVELWMGNFVTEYSDLKKLRERGIRSHLNGYKINQNNNKKSPVPELTTLVEELKQIKLWDSRIPTMVNSYFDDMFMALDQIYKALRPGGFCCIIVSNSAYGGIVVPTDLLLTKYAEKIGFKAKELDVARFIITSSQQYKKTEKYKKYLRETIIHLVK